MFCQTCIACGNLQVSTGEKVDSPRGQAADSRQQHDSLPVGQSSPGNIHGPPSVMLGWSRRGRQLMEM